MRSAGSAGAVGHHVDRGASAPSRTATASASKTIVGVPGGQSPRQEGVVSAVLGVHRAGVPDAGRAAHAGGPAVVRHAVDRQRDRAPGPAQPFGGARQQFARGLGTHRRHRIALRARRPGGQRPLLTGDSELPLRAGVVGLHLVVADRPVGQGRPLGIAVDRAPSRSPPGRTARPCPATAGCRHRRRRRSSRTPRRLRRRPRRARARVRAHRPRTETRGWSGPGPTTQSVDRVALAVQMVAAQLRCSSGPARARRPARCARPGPGSGPPPHRRDRSRSRSRRNERAADSAASPTGSSGSTGVTPVGHRAGSRSWTARPARTGAARGRPHCAGWRRSPANTVGAVRRSPPPVVWSVAASWRRRSCSSGSAAQKPRPLRVARPVVPARQRPPQLGLALDQIATDPTLPASGPVVGRDDPVDGGAQFGCPDDLEPPLR